MKASCNAGPGNEKSRKAFLFLPEHAAAVHDHYDSIHLNF